MFRAGWSASGRKRLMKAACTLHRGKTTQGVGEHDRARLEVTLGPSGNLVALKRADTAQAHPDRPALGVELHRGDERRLARRPPPTFAPTALPAPVRIIELHRTAQRARVVALLHHLHQLVLERPRGVVAHPQLSGQLQRRDPVLRLGHQVHRHKPSAQRQFRTRQDRACGQRDLIPAPVTLVQGTALHAPVPGMFASGANEPVRPTPTKQRIHALLLGTVLLHELRQAIAFLKLNPIPGHGWLPIFQPLATIRTALAHWMSFVRNQDRFWLLLGGERGRRRRSPLPAVPHAERVMD